MSGDSKSVPLEGQLNTIHHKQSHLQEVRCEVGCLWHAAVLRSCVFLLSSFDEFDYEVSDLYLMVQQFFGTIQFHT